MLSNFDSSCPTLDDEELDTVLKNMVTEEDAIFNDPTLRDMVMERLHEREGELMTTDVSAFYLVMND